MNDHIDLVIEPPTRADRVLLGALTLVRTGAMVVGVGLAVGVELALMVQALCTRYATCRACGRDFDTVVIGLDGRCAECLKSGRAARTGATPGE